MEQRTIERIEASKLDGLVVANTLPLSSAAKQCSKITTIDVSGIIAEAIRRTHNSESISSPPCAPTVTRNLIGGELKISKSRTWIMVSDPATQKLLTRVPDSTLAEVQNVVSAAESALPAWSELHMSKRTGLLLAFLEIVKANVSAFEHALKLEIGKITHDADSEIERGLDAIQCACLGMGKLKGEHWTDRSTDIFTTRKPLGVCLSITPFNFPFMIPLWSIPYALAAGNTVILKPSERAPSIAMLLGECAMEAGIPPGVFNIVHGSSSVVDKLLSQPAISAVSFVGSETAGERVFEHAKATRKRVQAETSGKNHGVVLDDANKTQTLYAVAGSAFGSSGQRCMALSVLVCVGDTKDWIDDLVTIAKSLKVGSGFDSSAAIGPLITAGSKERVKSIIDLAEAEGAHIALDGRTCEVQDYPYGNFVGPTIITQAKTYMQCYQEEIFGPVLVCLEVDSLEEAIELVNENRFGNGCTLFTMSPTHAQTFQRRINVGQIGINVPVLAPSGAVGRTTNKDSFLGDGPGGRSPWEFFTQTQTVTSLWR
ncbi:methylmalonate-semialdehyde dehydrogenase [Pyrenochaeta sp. DS3sAY3a]|nr:methylmalonate-semialdehyde dehydrogenase [Pyrenochaeta sp. DS3sAY3a]